MKVTIDLKEDSWRWFFKVLHGQEKGMEPPRGEYSLGNFWAIMQAIEGQVREVLGDED